MIRNSIKEIQKKLGSIENINYGGCGISALAFYRALKMKHPKIKLKFVYLYAGYSDKSFTENLKRLNNQSKKAVASAHCGILHCKRILDSSGIIDVGKYKCIQLINEEKFIIDSINNVGCWNSRFSRTNIKNIEKVLKIDLSDIIKKIEIKFTTEGKKSFSMEGRVI